MVNPSTASALKRRALNTAAVLEKWAERLQNEMKDQDIEPFPKASFFNKRDNDDSLPVSLLRGNVRNLIRDLNGYSAELRQFAK